MDMDMKEQSLLLALWICGQRVAARHKFVYVKGFRLFELKNGFMFGQCVVFVSNVYPAVRSALA
jgi:hypothetical protein